MMIIISACSQPTLNASDEDSLNRSFNAILDSASPDKRIETLKHFTRLKAAYVGHKAFFFEGENKEMRIQRWLNAVDGMNIEELYEESERVQQIWILGRLLAARKELQEYQEVVELLGNVDLINLELVPTEQPFDGARVEATIINDTGYTFYGAQFSAELLNEKGEYSRGYQLHFQIPDGINPGEQKRVTAYSKIRAGTPANFSAITLYDSVDFETHGIIANINFSVLPSVKGVEQVEAEYRSKYGSDEPAEWSKNIKRGLAQHNMYRGFRK